MTPLLIATLLTAEPRLVTTEQFRARFADLSQRRASLDARRNALPWIEGSASIATALLAAGVLWGAVGLMNPEHDSPVPMPVVFGASALNLVAAILLGALASQLEEFINTRTVELDREAERLRAQYSRSAPAL